MASESLLNRLYFALEDAYYAVIGSVNKLLPVYKYFVIPVEKRGLPSFVVFLVLLFLAGFGAYLYLNYGEEAFSGISPPSNFTLPFQLPTTPLGVTFKFVVEDDRGRPVSQALIEVFDGETSQQNFLQKLETSEGEARFESVPPRKISFRVSKQGFMAFTDQVDASQKNALVVTLACEVAGCTASTPTPFPTFIPTPSPSPTASPTPTGPPLQKKSFKVSVVDKQSGSPIAGAKITVKDSFTLDSLTSAVASSDGSASFQLVVGARVVIEAEATGYLRADSGERVLDEGVFAQGILLQLSPPAGQLLATTITILNENNAPTNATLFLFDKANLANPLLLEHVLNGSKIVQLDSSKDYFIQLNKSGYRDYAGAFFKGGQNQAVQLLPFFNGTLQYCRVEVASTEVGVNDPVSVRIVYANLSAPPSNLTLFCGTEVGQNISVGTCFNTTGNCTAQCIYSTPGSKSIFAQIGDFNCRSTSAVALNVSTRGPFCKLSLAPDSIAFNGSTTVTIEYSNLSAEPANAVLLVSCGNGFVGASNCTGTTGNCSTICRYNYSPQQVLDNPTRPVFVSFGGAQCIRDVRFADTAASLDVGVLFRGNYLNNARVALHKLVNGLPVFFASARASLGKASFGQLVRGDQFLVKAGDASGVMQGEATKFLDLPRNEANASVDLPPASFNATALDSATKTTTASLASANIVFSAFCNAISDDGQSYTRAFSLSSTCTAAGGSCTLSAKAFVSCFVNGSSPQFNDASEARQYSAGFANQSLKVERVFSHCGLRNEQCCNAAGSGSGVAACAGGLSCSQRICVDSVGVTSELQLTGSNGVVSSNVNEIIMKADPVFAADIVPLKISTDASCPNINAEVAGDSKVVSCFNDVSARPPFLKFDSSQQGCLVKSSGFSFPNAEATLALSCGPALQKTFLKIKIVGSTAEDSASFSPGSLPATGSANLEYVATQKQLEQEQLEVAPGTVAPAESVDNLPPTVSLLEPGQGSVVTGPVELVADARDNKRVAEISFFVDGVLLLKAVPPANKAVWDPSPSSVSLGAHTLSVEARDGGGNTASASVAVTKKTETIVASGIAGLNNLVSGGGSSVYYSFSGGIGLISSGCPSGCVFAELRDAPGLLSFASFAPSTQKAFYALQNEAGDGVLYNRTVQGVQAFLVQTDSGLASPLVFADASAGFYQKSSSILKTDGAVSSVAGGLSSTPTGFGYDANSLFLSSNPSGSGRVLKKDYSDSGSAFSTLSSTTAFIKSLAAKDGWVYWLQESPASVCKVLASGIGASSCAPYALLHPSLLSVDPDGSALYFLDGSSVKKVFVDWTGYVTLATGHSSARSLASNSDGVYVSETDSSTGKGRIVKISKSA